MKFMELVFLATIKSSLIVLLTCTRPAHTDQKVALLIIDVQDCFLPGGSLAVKDGGQVIPVINKIREDHEKEFDLVVVSQDWHCPNHVSFASQHPGHQPLSVINLTYNSLDELCYGNSVPYTFPYAVNCSSDEEANGLQVSQTLWPDHCIQNVTSGRTSAAFSPSLTMKPSDIVVRKGYQCQVDAYSAFYDNGGFHQTELDSLLKQHGIDVVVVVGLALDFCVYYTSKDAHTLGYKVLTVTDACRGVANSSIEAALQDMRNTGVQLITAAELGDALKLTSAATHLSPTSFVRLLVLAGIVSLVFFLQ